MSDWLTSPLKDLVTFQKGKKVEVFDAPVEGGLAYIGASSLEGGQADLFSLTSHSVVSQDTDVLMLWDGERSGLVGTGLSGVVGSTVSRLRPTEAVDHKFLYFKLANGFSWIQQNRTGTGVPHVPKDLGKIFAVSYPHDLIEQRKIAIILSTVDNLIEKTQALIDKYQSIKQGMMYDLFTRGVDENGQLRSSCEEAPHLYKESELGWIPKEWECSRVGKYLKSINQGWSPNCDSDAADQDEWGVLKTTAVTWNGYSDVENKVLPSSLKPKPEHEVSVGDVLVTRAGPNSRVGVVAYVYQTRPMLMLSDKLYRLVSNGDLNGEFLSLALSSSGSQNDLSSKKTGLAESQTNISQGIVKDILIPIPSSSEQALIADILRRKSLLIEAEIKSLKKLNTLKAGLMQDLLTGKVRVGI